MSQTDLWSVQAEAAGLTDAEREVYAEVERHGVGPRELARQTERSPGTISNLLRRAREKIENGGEQA